MTAAERSYFGLCKQVSKGTPITVDTNFKYILFSQGAGGVNNIVVPLDSEVGGGAVLRDVIKAGASVGGAFEFIPRADTLGQILLGLLGKDTVTGTLASGGFVHAFTLDTDRFAVPYWTTRLAPGGMWWEQYQDCRINALTLDFKAASFVRGSLGFVGAPSLMNMTAPSTPAASTTTCPPFTTPTGHFEIPLATPYSVLSGSFTAGNAIPLDEQFYVGGLSPADFDITQRAFALSLNIKVTDKVLYEKMAYDPAGSATTWKNQMFKEGQFKFDFASESLMPGVTGPAAPYKLAIAGHASEENVAWTVTPIGLRAGKQVIMNVTGIFLASSAGDPITMTLTNATASY